MPFRLSNAPASFLDYINKILAKKFNIFVIVYLDDIFIYIKDLGQSYIEVVRWVLDVLRRHRLFANLKKYQFHKDEVCFLGYIILDQGVRREDEQIEAVKNWHESMLIKDIPVFIGFVNFYQCFIRGFSKIATPLISMLKTTRSSEKSAPRAFKAGNNKVVEGGGNETVVNLFKNEKSRKLTHMPNIGATEEPNFLIPNAKKAFNYLRLAFIKAPIL